MSHSLNEIEALAKRAARGAGLSWGMAEEAAKATRWLDSHDLAGSALLAHVLTQNDGLPHAHLAPAMIDGAWHAPSRDMCPIACGTTLNDCAERLADGQSIEMVNVTCPLLIVPFAAWAALHIRQPVSVCWLDLRIDTDGEGIWIDGPNAQVKMPRAPKLTCKSAPRRHDAPRRPNQRGTVTTEVAARLNAFAQRTYAPATEASRMLGAGAGVLDND